MPDNRLPTDGPAEALVAVYAAVDAQLRHIIRAAAMRGAGGTQRYYERQQRQVRRILADLEGRTPAVVEAMVRSTYDPVSVATARVLGVEPGFTGVDEGTVEVLVRALTGDLEGAVRTVGRQAEDVFRRITLEEVALGVARGETKSVPARIRNRLADEGTTCLIDRGGRRWTLERYARMAATTTGREAHTVAVANRMEQHGSDLIEMSYHAQSCPICLPWQGRTYSLSGVHPTYPKLTVSAPVHPFCRHVMHPATATFEEFERELGLAVA